ncbi:MAG: hypothetical protein CL613_02055 [Aquimarina sp.]|nr:hypothetical protein [Aquimarina sp.]
MSSKKNIDRLFQEKFKDFEATPNDVVWERIKASQQKKKRRVLILPIWYKAAGIAAAIAILFTVLYNWSDNDTKIEIVDTTTNNPEENIPSDNNNTDQNRNVFNESQNTETLDYVLDQNDKNEGSHNPSNTSNALFKTSNPKIQNTTIGNTNTSRIDQNDRNSDSDEQKKSNLTNTAIADQTPEEIENKGVNLSENRNQTPTNLTSEENTTIANEETTDKANDGKKSIFDVIKESEDIIAEKPKDKDKRWNVSPMIGPVYYDHEGNGSSVDSRFSDNGKIGELNLSYGVQLAYQLSDKLSVRTGLSKVDLSYSTKDVGFSPSIAGQNLKNVDYNENSVAIYISDLNGPTSQPSTLSPDINNEVVAAKQNEGVLSHEFNYLEVPLELKYALVNKKIGINMIGGISTLFLQGNELSIESGDFTTKVGRVNNLNEVSFSGNLGLGVDYKLNEQFILNLEPIFKYQFNAIDDNEGNFRPYYFGVYTGVSFKF